MFITKKKLNEMLKDREEKIREEYQREARMHDQEMWTSRRFDDVAKRLWEIEEKLKMNDKQDTTCNPRW